MFAEIVLWLAALNWILAGSSALAFPRATAALLELELGAPISRSDFRAVYGGLRLGAGVFLGWAAWSGQVRVGLTAAGLLFGGNLIGRVASLLIDGPPGRVGSSLLVLETLGLVVVGAALAQSTPSL